jgi:hypothetical protein
LKEILSSGTVKWKKGVGYSNPHSKLKTCFGGEKKFLAAYWAAYIAKDTETNTICAAILTHAAGFTPKETALANKLNMSIVKNWALSSVECKMHHDIMCKKHKQTFSVKCIWMMMFILGEVIGYRGQDFQDACE